MSLYKLNEKYQELAEKMDDPDVDPEVLKDTLDSIQDARDQKLDAIAWLIEQNTKDIEWDSQKLKDYQNDKRIKQNKNESLMRYMTTAIDQSGLKEIHTDNHVYKPRNYRASVEITDEDKLPKDYLVVKTEEKVDKKQLYKDLKNGTEVPGAELKPNRKTRIL